MSSQKPFFGSFLAAFRAHTAMQKAAASTQASSVSGSAQPSRKYTTQTPANTTTQTSNPRTTTSKTAKPSTSVPTTTTTSTTSTTSTTTSSAGQFKQTRQASTSPYSRSPASPASPGFSNGARKTRRGSDSSTEGFRDVLGDQKWYIGGRTAAGEERFYKLGVVKRNRSIDRLSLDRMSL